MGLLLPLNRSKDILSFTSVWPKRREVGGLVVLYSSLFNIPELIDRFSSSPFSPVLRAPDLDALHVPLLLLRRLESINKVRRTEIGFKNAVKAS